MSSHHSPIRILSIDGRPITLAAEADAVRRRAGFQAGLPVDQRQRRLKVYRSTDHNDVTAQIPWDRSLQRRLPPAIPGEESGRVLPGSFVRGQLQIRGVTGGGEGVRVGLIWIPSGSQGVTKGRCVFCGQTRCFSGVEVYRKSTDDSGLGKSAAKASATVQVLRVQPAVVVQAGPGRVVSGELVAGRPAALGALALGQAHQAA